MKIPVDSGNELNSNGEIPCPVQLTGTEMVLTPTESQIIANDLNLIQPMKNKLNKLSQSAKHVGVHYAENPLFMSTLNQVNNCISYTCKHNNKCLASSTYNLWSLPVNHILYIDQIGRNKEKIFWQIFFLVWKHTFQTIGESKRWWWAISVYYVQG